MIKERFRDYATAAFIDYFKLGQPTRSQHEERIRREIYSAYPLSSQETRDRKALEAIDRSKPLLDDIDAVNIVFDILGGAKYDGVYMPVDVTKNGADIADAIRYVYCGLHREKPSYSRIAGRVRRYSTDKYVSDRNVYRWLKVGMRLFAIVRGLYHEK